MQPYVNPNYFNGYQSPYQPLYNNPVPAPAVQQMNNLYQKYAAPGINGRGVNDFSEITADDVPTNGTYAFFVKGDMSEIQARTWAPDGKIVSVSFKRVSDDKANNSTNDQSKTILGLSDEATTAFMNRFDEIANRLDTLEDICSRQTTGSRRKKEVEAE